MRSLAPSGMISRGGTAYSCRYAGVVTKEQMEGKILIARRKRDGKWTPPGGNYYRSSQHSSNCYNVTDSLMNWLSRGVGLTLDKVNQQLGNEVFFKPDKSDKLKVMSIFLCSASGQVACPADGPYAEAKWVGISDLPGIAPLGGPYGILAEFMLRSLAILSKPIRTFSQGENLPAEIWGDERSKEPHRFIPSHGVVTLSDNAKYLIYDGSLPWESPQERYGVRVWEVPYPKRCPEKQMFC